MTQPDLESALALLRIENAHLKQVNSRLSGDLDVATSSLHHLASAHQELQDAFLTVCRLPAIGNPLASATTSLTRH